MKALSINNFSNTIIAGPTYSGKTEMLHTFLLSMMANNSSKDLSIYIADTSDFRYKEYKDTNHVNGNVAVGTYGTLHMLEELIYIMEERHRDLEAGLANSRNPHNIVLVIDNYEALADIKNFDDMSRYLTNEVYNLAKKGPEVGIYLIISTRIIAKTLIPNNTLEQFDRRILKGDIKKLSLTDGDVSSYIGEIEDIGSALLIEDGTITSIKTEYVPLLERVEVIKKLARNDSLSNSSEPSKRPSIMVSFGEQVKRMFVERKIK